MTSPLEIRGSLLARNTVLNLMGQMVPLLVGVLTIPFIVRGLGTEGFGVLSLALVVLGYFSIFDLGLGRATTKFAAESLGRGDHDALRQSVWTSLGLQVLVGIAAGILLSGITPPLVTRVFSVPPPLVAEATGALLLIALSLPVVLGAATLRGVLEAAQRFDLVNAVKIPANASIFLLPLIGVLLGFRLPGIMALLLASRFAAGFGYLALSLRAVPSLRGRLSIDLGRARSLLSYGVWIMATSMISPFLVYLERFLVGSLLTMSALAYYTASYELVTRLWILPASLTPSLFPAFSTLSSVGNRIDVEDLSVRSMKYLLLVLGPLTVVLALFSEEILRVWLGRDFAAQGTLVLQILALGVLVNSIGNVPYTLLQGVGRPDIPAKFHVVELPVYAIVAWFFVSRWGITGAAAAWSLRAIADALLLLGAAFSIRRMSLSAMRRNGLLWTLLVLVLFSGATYTANTLVAGLQFQIVVVAALLALFAWFVWQYVLAENEKRLFAGLFQHITAGR